MNISYRKKIIVMGAVLSIGILGTTTYASNLWGGYHWARSANPFTLKLGDNVSPAWDAYLFAASTEWNVSSVLDTAIVFGQSNPKNCRATNGRVEVCNSKYGNNGWLGIASIWADGNHITQGTVKLNDTYFNNAKYNTPEWKQFVTCQEIGHTLGLDHQDEVFTNPNLDTCMDYTNDPTTNQKPNSHDYEMLETLYTHLDSFTSSLNKVSTTGANHAANIDTSNQSEWGKSIRTSPDGRSSLYERDFGNGQKIFTFVTWAD